MKIVAKFIGRTSCGFVSNGTYEIKMKFKDKWIWIYDLHSAARCPYSNINKVAENWRMPVEKITNTFLPESNGIWKD